MESLKTNKGNANILLQDPGTEDIDGTRKFLLDHIITATITSFFLTTVATLVIIHQNYSFK